MAETSSTTTSSSSKPTRLQKRAPKSLDITRADWNVAIPLLSPLMASPTAEISLARGSTSDSRRGCDGEKKLAAVTEMAPALVMKKWQHPAAPFGYEPAPFIPFVPV